MLTFGVVLSGVKHVGGRETAFNIKHDEHETAAIEFRDVTEHIPFFYYLKKIVSPTEKVY
jgi:hypothetical protein